MTARMGKHAVPALGPDEVVAVEVLRAAVKKHKAAMLAWSRARTQNERESCHARIVKADREVEAAKVDLADVLAGEP